MSTEIELARTLKIWSRYFAVIPNFYIGEWECDLFTLNKTGFTAEYEIKKTEADYQNDFKKITYWGKIRSRVKNHHYDLEPDMKHHQIQHGKRTNYFWFVMPEAIAEKVTIPEYAGLITYKLVNNRGHIEHSFTKVKRAPLIHRVKTEFPKTGILRRVIEAYYWRGQIIPRKKRRTNTNNPEFPEMIEQERQQI